jgi:hypothetical protein
LEELVLASARETNCSLRRCRFDQEPYETQYPVLVATFFVLAEAGRVSTVQACKPHEATLPQISGEALLLWTTCSGLAARAFLEIGVN